MTTMTNQPDDPAELAEWHAGHPPRGEQGEAAMDPRERTVRTPGPGDRPGSIPQHQTDVTFGTIDFAKVNKRAALLETAERIVNGARNVQYGDPNADFARTAVYWQTHMISRLERFLHGHLPGPEVAEIMGAVRDIAASGVRLVAPTDVAVLMALLKISRLAWSPDHADNWLDLAGYAACGYDCSDAELPEGQVGR